MFLKWFSSFCLVLLCCFQTSAQNTEAAKVLLDKAVEYYQKQDYKRAKMNAVKAVSKDSLFADPYILLEDIFQDTDELNEAILTYSQGFRLDSVKFRNSLLTIAKLELETEQFSKAVKHAKWILQQKRANADIIRKAENIIASAEFREKAFMNPLELEKIKLKYVSHGADEYINDISLDGKRILFTQKTKVELDSGLPYFTENIYSAELKNDTIRNIRDYELPEEMKDKAGAASFSADGRYLFFTVCDETANCELFLLSLKSPERKVFNLGRNVNSREWDSQPCFSADGKTLFFASKREGGFGGSDIWYSTLNDKGHFSRPVNAGATINTDEDEMAPFIHPDSEHLYFSSNGHPGMGGFDLFVSEKDSTNNWSRAVNLGYPLNTRADEINMIIAADGKNAYLSAKGNDFDMYHFELTQHNPAKVMNVVGQVLDSESKEPVYAKVELYDLEKEMSFALAQSFATDGVFNIPLPVNTIFACHIAKDGYLFYSDNFHVTDEAVIDTLEILLQPIKIDQRISLRNIFFETDSYALLDASIFELNKLTGFLKNNPTLSIEIGGHTDNRGEEAYNLTLSEQRAKSVYDYLVKQGIKLARLRYKGYGESEAVATNETSQGRALNRRTECKIIGLN